MEVVDCEVQLAHVNFRAAPNVHFVEDSVHFIDLIRPASIDQAGEAHAKAHVDARLPADDGGQTPLKVLVFKGGEEPEVASGEGHRRGHEGEVALEERVEMQERAVTPQTQAQIQGLVCVILSYCEGVRCYQIITKTVSKAYESVAMVEGTE